MAGEKLTKRVVDALAAPKPSRVGVKVRESFVWDRELRGFGVQVMPTYAGSSGGHQTISGPDNWVVFDNGDQKKRAAIDFVKWLTAPEQVKAFSLGTGDLPTRTSVGRDPAVLKALDEKVPGSATFVENLNNVEKVRPTVEQYPDVSEALGQAIVAVMLGKEQPAAALDAAAQEAVRQRATAELKAAGAHYVIDSVADLLPVLDAIDARLAAGELPAR